MNRMFECALKFARENAAVWQHVGYAIDLRAYLANLIDHMANKELAELYREQLAELTDDQLKGIST